MWKRLLLATLTGLASSLLPAALASASDTFIIDDCVKRKSAVEFPHALHFDMMECSSCHHTQEDLSKDTADQAVPCGDCHTAPEEPGTPACSQMSMKKNHFHISCVACHKEKAAGPTKCNECHPKD